jgi:alkylation response protein AidB-like acyl-CoA dehydrogenase
MTIVSRHSTTGQAEILRAVHELVPDIAARAHEIEAGRRVPLDLLDRLKEAGCFRLLRPPSHGVVDGDLSGAMTVYEELSRADASTAWITLIGGVAWVDLAGLPRAMFDAVLPPDGDAVIAGVFSPSGTAIPSDGGFVVEGRWSFASGCEHADWIYGGCIDTSTGEPAMRIALFRPEEVVIEDTWSVVGLRGTGSHHFTARGVLVPAERTTAIFSDPPCVDLPLTRIPVPTAAALLMASVPLGVAQGALDDVTALSAGKVPLLSESPLATAPCSSTTWATRTCASGRPARCCTPRLPRCGPPPKRGRRP